MTDAKPINSAAIRHLVFFDLVGWLPVANCEQTERFLFNLRLNMDSRFLQLRVSPDIGLTPTGAPDLATTEQRLNRKFGERLQYVPGFYRRGPEYPFHINMPRNCALFFYGDRYTSFGPVPHFYNGVLCQPLDRRNFHFLLSSAKLQGPRAAKLSPADNLYFTQYEEAAA